MSDPLRSLGWDDHWRQRFETVAAAGDLPARILIEYQDRVRVGGADGESEATLSGRLRDVTDKLERPAVGDWVAIRRAEDGSAVVAALVPRRTVFVRRAAGEREVPQIISANVDRVFIVSSLNREFNARRIERYVAAVHEARAEPILVMNKCDTAEAARYLRDLNRTIRTLPIVVSSAIDGTGIDALHGWLTPGLTVAFVGSSGVGKSTLINRIIGSDDLPTAEVRRTDDRGRHTTRNRTLICLPTGAILIDTPGMRELQLWADAEAIRAGFADVEAAAESCRFGDCRHAGEPGCAVADEIASGALDAARVASYQKLLAELEGGAIRGPRS